MRRCICHCYIKQSADWASPQRRLCKGFNFIAAYEREREREIACYWTATMDSLQLHLGDYGLPHINSQYSHAPYSLQASSLMNRCGLPPPVAVRDYIGHVCSVVKLGHLCECRRQCTREQWTSALRRQTTCHKNHCRCRPPTWDFKGSCHRLSCRVPSWSPTMGQSDALRHSSALCVA